MARLQSLSLFTRLYLSVAIAVVVSGTLSLIVIEKWDSQNEIDEFVFFTDYVYADLLKQGEIKPNNAQQDLDKSAKVIDVLSMSWQIVPIDTSPCDGCELIGRSGKVDVYRNELDQFMAVYTFLKSNTWLFIGDLETETVIFDESEGLVYPEQYSEQYEDEEYEVLSFDEIAPMLLLSIVLITIASTIYWPIRALQNQIEKLIKIQHQFGAGDMNIKAEEQLARPLNELASSFNAMASSIKDTVNENQLFAQAVPHEVRTPLSRIQLAAGLLRKSNESKQAIELLDNIDTYIGDINELISQVVAFSRLNSTNEEGEFELYQSIELCGFIESRIKAIKCEEKLRVIRLIDESLEITTNPVYLRLLVDNLLKNASIHAKAQILISLSTIKEQIELTIEDDGEGIPQESFDTIFMPFSRLDVSRSRKTGGLGLGLAISKAACKRMNSELIVENNKTGGARFTCRFSDAV
jgi:signal transduction histidine kinase